MSDRDARHRVYRVRESVPGDAAHPEPPLTPCRVCSDCGKAVTHLGRMVRGTPWVHGKPGQP